jgi:hypothetical protein
LELAFATSHLRKICESTSAAERLLGKFNANILKRRLADLRAHDNVGEIVLGNPEILKVSPPAISITIFGDSKLIFCSNHNQSPLLESGDINWALVNRIKILEIKN